MRVLYLLALAASLATAPAILATNTEKEAPPPDLQSLVLAERAFARTSVADGVRDAFLAFLAPDAVIFRPGPVPARDWLEKSPPVPGRLSWEPLLADVARSGDFGYTTGPWQYLPPGEAVEPAHGHYVSVWRSEPETGWRVIVDFGNSHPQPESTLGDLSYPAPRPESGNRRAGSNHEESPAAALRAADTGFAGQAAESGTAAACKELADEAIRVYRSGIAPLVGKTKSCAALAASSERSASLPLGSRLARSGDLGYVYGNLEFLPRIEDEPAVAVRRGSFLRIWKTDRSGDWKLVLDVSILHPPAPPAAAAGAAD